MILDGVVAGQRTPCAAEPAGEAALVGGFDAERPDQRGDRGFAQQEGTAGEVGRQTDGCSHIDLVLVGIGCGGPHAKLASYF